jgi:hypothetical protein
MRTIQGTDALGSVTGMMDQALRATMPAAPCDRLVQRSQRQASGVLTFGYRPTDNTTSVYVGHERRTSKTTVRELHIRDVSRMQSTRSTGVKLSLHRVLPTAPASRRTRGCGDTPATHATHSTRLHDMRHLVSANMPPALTSRLHEHFPIPVHGLKPVGVNQLDIPSQSLMTSPHPTDSTLPSLEIATSRDRPTSRSMLQGPADRLTPQTTLIRVNVRDHQRPVGWSREAKEAEAVCRISSARRSCATSRRSFLNSPDPPGEAVCTSARSRQRRSDSGATSKFPATPCNASVSDE